MGCTCSPLQTCQTELDNNRLLALTTFGRTTAPGVCVTASIEVEQLKAGEFRVRVIEDRSETSHVVILQPDVHQRLAGGKAPPEELLKRSFEFLLEREPKESILARFELPVIAQYFPEYEREIKRRL